MNFLKDKKFWLTLVLAGLLTVFFCLASNFSSLTLLFFLIFLLVLLFLKYPIIGIYLMAFLYPFNYLEASYDKFNVPLVDLIALVLFITWVVRSLYLHLENKQKISLKNFPAWIFMLFFIGAGAVSLLNVESSALLASVKFILRPMLFFYLMFVILPFNIIDSFKKLYNTLNVMFVLGVGLALMGIWSFIFPPYYAELRRAVPLSVFGYYPLGTNHNLLAEVFVALMPFALILFWREKDVFLKNIYLLGAFLMGGVNLLTLSRAGWLALIFQLLILLALKYKGQFKKIFSSFFSYLLLALLAPLAYLVYQFATTGVVIGATLNRMQLIEGALFLFREHPFIGNGPGTFISALEGMRWYIIQYGEPLEAHGFIFKTLPELGILGTFAFLALLAYIFYALLKGYNNIKLKPQYANLVLGMILAVVGVVVFQVFGTGYYMAKLWLPIGLALASLKLCWPKFTEK